MENILILGSSGFIGSSLSEYLTKLDINVSRLHCTRLKLCDLKSNYDVSQLFSTLNPSIVIGSFGTRRERCSNDTQKNLSDYLACIDQLVKALNTYNVSHYIHLSTDAVRESRSYLEPVHRDYVYSRRIAEDRLLCLSATSNLKLHIIRPTIVYGSTSIKDKLRPLSIMNDCINGTEISVWGDGGELRNYIHVADVCRYIMSIIKEPDKFPVVITAHHETYSLIQIIDMCSSIAHTKPKIVFKERTIAPYDFIQPQDDINLNHNVRMAPWLTKTRAILIQDIPCLTDCRDRQYTRDTKIDN